MQLELFDFRTENAGLKSKVGKTTGKAGEAAASQKTGATGKSGADFLTSLRMVSKKSQANSDDLPAAAGPDLAAQEPRLTRLGDVLNEILREWPAGRRPAVAIGARGDRNKTAAPETTPTSSGVLAAAPSEPTVTILGPGKARPSSDRAKAGLDSFTNALIKRLSRAHGQKSTSLVAGPDTGNTAANQNSTNVAVASQALAADKRGKGNGIRILKNAEAAQGASTVLKLKNARSGQSAPIDRNPRIDAADQKAGTGAERTTDRPVTTDLNNERHPRVRQIAEDMKAATIKGEPKTARQSETAHPGSRVNRAVNAEHTGQIMAAKSAAVKTGLPKVSVISSDQPAAAINVNRPGQVARPNATAAVKQAAPRMKRDPGRPGAKHTETSIPAPDKSRMTTARAVADPALRKSPQKSDTAKTMPAGSSNSKGPASLHVPRERDEEMPGLKTVKADIKTAAALDNKAAARAEFSAGERDRFGHDGVAGQAARDARGGEQTRIEVADARLKPAEPAAVVPKSPPATLSTTAPDSEKTVLDRVSEARVLEQISTRIRLQPKNGAHEIRIQLKPETLGQMQLKILAHDQAISVKMVAETAMARDIIEHNIGQLRADLNALGLNVEKLDVEVISTGDPAEKDAAGQRGGFAKHGRGAAQQGGRDHEPGENRARQMQAEEDEAEEGTLVGVFA